MSLLKEPLLHFLFLGGCLFAVHAWWGRDRTTRPVDEIVITPGRIATLANAFEKTWQRPPAPPELDGLVEEFVREEVLYREALALGLDRDDTIVRRRMRQKMGFLSEDLASLAEPTGEDLQAYLDEHPEYFRVDAELTFQHVYFNPDTRAGQADRDAKACLALLEAGQESDGAHLGDRFMPGQQFDGVSAREVQNTFGAPFCKSLLALPLQAWAGPVKSGYGLHLVRVDRKRDARVPPLEEIRDRVAREWETARRKELADAFYASLRARYRVTVESPATSTAPILVRNEGTE